MHCLLFCLIVTLHIPVLTRSQEKPNENGYPSSGPQRPVPGSPKSVETGRSRVESLTASNIKNGQTQEEKYRGFPGDPVNPLLPIVKLNRSTGQRLGLKVEVLEHGGAAPHAHHRHRSAQHVAAVAGRVRVGDSRRTALVGKRLSDLMRSATRAAFQGHPPDGPDGGRPAADKTTQVVPVPTLNLLRTQIIFSWNRVWKKKKRLPTSKAPPPWHRPSQKRTSTLLPASNPGVRNNRSDEHDTSSAAEQAATNLRPTAGGDIIENEGKTLSVPWSSNNTSNGRQLTTQERTEVDSRPPLAQSADGNGLASTVKAGQVKSPANPAPPVVGVNALDNPAPLLDSAPPDFSEHASVNLAPPVVGVNALDNPAPLLDSAPPDFSEHASASPDFSEHASASPGFSEHASASPDFSEHASASPDFSEHASASPAPSDFSEHASVYPAPSGFSEHPLINTAPPDFREHASANQAPQTFEPTIGASPVVTSSKGARLVFRVVPTQTPKLAETVRPIGPVAGHPRSQLLAWTPPSINQTAAKETAENEAADHLKRAGAPVQPTSGLPDEPTPSLFKAREDSASSRGHNALKRRRRRRRIRRDAGNIFADVLGLDPNLDDVIGDFIGEYPQSRSRDRRTVLSDKDMADELRRQMTLDKIIQEDSASLSGVAAGSAPVAGLGGGGGGGDSHGHGEGDGTAHAMNINQGRDVIPRLTQGLIPSDGDLDSFRDIGGGEEAAAAAAAFTKRFVSDVSWARGSPTFSNGLPNSTAAAKVKVKRQGTLSRLMSKLDDDEDDQPYMSVGRSQGSGFREDKLVPLYERKGHKHQNAFLGQKFNGRLSSRSAEGFLEPSGDGGKKPAPQVQQHNLAATGEKNKPNSFVFALRQSIPNERAKRLLSDAGLSDDELAAADTLHPQQLNLMRAKRARVLDSMFNFHPGSARNSRVERIPLPGDGDPRQKTAAAQPNSRVKRLHPVKGVEFALSKETLHHEVGDVLDMNPVETDASDMLYDRILRDNRINNADFHLHDHLDGDFDAEDGEGDLIMRRRRRRRRRRRDTQRELQGEERMLRRKTKKKRMTGKRDMSTGPSVAQKTPDTGHSPHRRKRAASPLRFPSSPFPPGQFPTGTASPGAAPSAVFPPGVTAGHVERKAAVNGGGGGAYPGVTAGHGGIKAALIGAGGRLQPGVAAGNSGIRVTLTGGVGRLQPGVTAGNSEIRAALTGGGGGRLHPGITARRNGGKRAAVTGDGDGKGGLPKGAASPAGSPPGVAVVTRGQKADTTGRGVGGGGGDSGRGIPLGIAARLAKTVAITGVGLEGGGGGGGQGGVAAVPAGLAPGVASRNGGNKTGTPSGGGGGSGSGGFPAGAPARKVVKKAVNKGDEKKVVNKGGKKADGDDEKKAGGGDDDKKAGGGDDEKKAGGGVKKQAGGNDDEKKASGGVKNQAGDTTLSPEQLKHIDDKLESKVVGSAFFSAVNRLVEDQDDDCVNGKKEEKEAKEYYDSIFEDKTGEDKSKEKDVSNDDSLDRFFTSSKGQLPKAQGSTNDTEGLKNGLGPRPLMSPTPIVMGSVLPNERVSVAIPGYFDDRNHDGLADTGFEDIVSVNTRMMIDRIESDALDGID